MDLTPSTVTLWDAVKDFLPIAVSLVALGRGEYLSRRASREMLEDDWALEVDFEAVTPPGTLILIVIYKRAQKRPAILKTVEVLSPSGFQISHATGRDVPLEELEDIYEHEDEGKGRRLAPKYRLDGLDKRFSGRPDTKFDTLSMLVSPKKKWPKPPFVIEVEIDFSFASARRGGATIRLRTDPLYYEEDIDEGAI